MLYKYALGHAIRTARLSQNLTQRDVCDKAFIALGHLSEMERGLTEVSSTMVENVALALGLEPYELVIEAGYLMAGVQIPDTVEALLDLTTIPKTV